MSPEDALRRLDHAIEKVVRAKRNGVRLPIGCEADLRAVRSALADMCVGYQQELPL